MKAAASGTRQAHEVIRRASVAGWCLSSARKMVPRAATPSEVDNCCEASAQSGRARGAPKGRDGAVEAIRTLMVARRSAAGERAQASCRMPVTCQETLYWARSRGLEDIRWAANDRGVAALPGRPDQW